MNENKMRPWIYVFVTLLHFILILFIVFDTQDAELTVVENARVMRLIDLNEITPPPPLREEEDIPRVEDIAEVMIETDTAPVQTVVSAGTLVAPSVNTVGNITPPEEEYLPMHMITDPPQFNINSILADLVYPQIAQRSGIEGRVILELFIDRTGTVQSVIILREDPEGRGFGEAAVKAFMGRKGTPAMANGVPVSTRYRYPLSFVLK